MGAAGHLGISWTYLAIPIFLWASWRQMLLRDLGKRVIPSPRIVWLSSQSPSPAAGHQIGSPRRARSCVVISWLPRPSHFPLGSSSLSFPEVLAAWPTPLPGPSCTAPSFLLSLSASAILIRRLPPRKEGFCSINRLLKGLHPSKTGGGPGLFLTVSREEDSTTYFESCSLIDSSQSRNFLLASDFKFNSCNWSSFSCIPLDGEGCLRSP